MTTVVAAGSKAKNLERRFQAWVRVLPDQGIETTPMLAEGLQILIEFLQQDITWWHRLNEYRIVEVSEMLDRLERALPSHHGVQKVRTRYVEECLHRLDSAERTHIRVNHRAWSLFLTYIQPKFLGKQWVEISDLSVQKLKQLADACGQSREETEVCAAFTHRAHELVLHRTHCHDGGDVRADMTAYTALCKHFGLRVTNVQF